MASGTFILNCQLSYEDFFIGLLRSMKEVNETSNKHITVKMLEELPLLREDYDIDIFAPDLIEIIPNLDAVADDYNYIKTSNSYLILIKNIFLINQKKCLNEFIEKLSCFEQAEILQNNKHRDHVIHAFNTFVLGAYIIKKCISDESERQGLYHSWKLASMLHDIGYGNTIEADIVILNNNKDSTKLISNKLKEWNIYLDVHKIIEDSLQSNASKHHGVRGSLMFLKKADEMFQIHNPKRLASHKCAGSVDWSEVIFENDVVDSAAAIFLHDQKGITIDYKYAKLAFLTVVCDVLQEWNRYKQGNSYIYAGTCFSIDFKDSLLSFNINNKALSDKVIAELNCYKLSGLCLSVNGNNAIETAK